METLSCPMIGDLLPKYADGTCSEETRVAVETHLESCPACREEFSRMKREIPSG